MKFYNTQVVFREFPDEITLAINITNCPCHCKGCHSTYLAEDIGEELSPEKLKELIDENPGITCVGFMGGDASPEEVLAAAVYIRNLYPDLNIGWYSGRDRFPDGCTFEDLWVLDYIKLGHYDETKGGLDDSRTNQRMYWNRQDGFWEDITYRFWGKNLENH